MLSASQNQPTTAVVCEAVAHDSLVCEAHIRDMGADRTQSARMVFGEVPEARALATNLARRSIVDKVMAAEADGANSDAEADVVHSLMADTNALVSGTTASKGGEADRPEIAPADESPPAVVAETTVYTLGVTTTTEDEFASSESREPLSLQPAVEGGDAEVDDTFVKGSETPVLDSPGDESTTTSDPETTTASTESPEDQRTDDTVVQEPEPPVIYTLGNESSTADDSGTTADDDIAYNSATSVQLRRIDVKRIARAMKLGHDVDLDINALMEFHSRASKLTRQTIERVIATAYAEYRLVIPVAITPEYGWFDPPRTITCDVQALEEAYVALGSPTSGLRINGTRVMVPPPYVLCG
jgi:hypothetical protein